MRVRPLTKLACYRLGSFVFGFGRWGFGRIPVFVGGRSRVIKARM
jgi:hypothetical protein